MKNLTSESIIFHTVEKSHQNFKITNNDFICLNSNDEEVTPTLNILYSSDNGFSSSNVFLYNNSSYIFFEQNNRINYNTLNSSI
jgi:LytS/YehU family sensor histidine kinase